MRTTSFFILILFNTYVIGQQAETLLINVSKNEIKDGYCIYDLSVQNKSDSIACLLHSIFIDLTADTPQGLAVYIKGRNKEEYSLHRSFEDTTYDAEAMPRKGECILPHQTLNFKIQILKSRDDRSKYLTVSYFYLTDMCYKDLKKEMKDKVGNWYYKYNRLKQSVKL